VHSLLINEKAIFTDVEEIMKKVNIKGDVSRQSCSIFLVLVLPITRPYFIWKLPLAKKLLDKIQLRDKQI